MNNQSIVVELPKYKFLEEIYSGIKTKVYRGQREEDQTSVIIKILKSDYPSVRDLMQFRHQYALAKNLNIPGLIKPYILENYGNGYALVMEDFGGISLLEYAGCQPLSLDEFFPIALQIVCILEALSHNGIVHKDIKPQNILINPQTKEIKLIDLSIATLLSREIQEMQTPNFLEGTLAYIAPEQTGRMNRGIDYRSDFYSLGVSFYELLTGQLPFQSNEPLELVHCHIAKQPTPPIEINSTIPLPINDLILTLMAKTAEDRYQSATGIKLDLEICWQQWKQNRAIHPLGLSHRKLCDRFLIPEKLYGRETEVSALVSAFVRVASPKENRASLGSRELLLVAGFSGIGKTAIVNEVHKSIVKARGYFIKGKFDQFKRNIPFSAFVQAFRDLIGQAISESPDRLEQWKANILEALGENAGVIVEVIPELETILEPQPPVVELSGTAAQNRFNLLFGKFINVFATAEHPLVIFIDDLQWADSASLKLMQVLASESDTKYLLLIGAYRNNEVSPDSPLMLTLDEIKKAGERVQILTLSPLSFEAIAQLITETLNSPVKLALPLAEWVYQKTKGNPFFAIQFIKSLHADGLIAFDANQGFWQFNIAKSQAQSSADDVVEFMASQLEKLPKKTQEVLKLAACVGNKFDLEMLGIVSEKSSEEIADSLWPALQEGLVLPLSNAYKFFQEADATEVKKTADLSVTYKFLHDRVQQAAYFLIPEDRKQATHLKIGQLLLSKGVAERAPTDKDFEDKIFDIVNQLNYGIELIHSQKERDNLAQLNLKAGCKAKAATAYVAAQKYFTVGSELLASDSLRDSGASRWKTNYNLTLALYESAAEVAYLNGNFQSMEKWIEEVLQSAKTLLEKLKVYEVRIQAFTAQNKLQEAVSTGLEVLQALGVIFPANPSPSDFNDALEETNSRLADRKVESLIDLPEMTAPDKLAAMRILLMIFSPAYQGVPQLLPLVILKMVNLSIEFGNAGESMFGYVNYASLLCGVIGNVELGYQFGKLGLRLVEQFTNHPLECRTRLIFNALVYPWKKALQKSIQPLERNYHIGRDRGDVEFAGYSAFQSVLHSCFSGRELAEVEEKIATYIPAIRQVQQQMTLNHLSILWQFVLNLLGDTDDPCSLNGSAYREEEMRPLHEQANNNFTLAVLYFHKLILCCLFQDFQQAITVARLARDCMSAATGNIIVPFFHFYDSLAGLAVFSEDMLPSERESWLVQVRANQEKLQFWAKHAPKNYLHKFYLVEAERHRVLGENVEAMDNYDRAIALAQKNGYLYEEALANQLAAQFYLAWGKETIARAYMTNAYYGYERWGAKAKVQDLEKRYPQLLVSVVNRENNAIAIGSKISSLTTSSLTSTSSRNSAILDFATAMKAAQAISSEIVLDNLLATLMKTLVQNAGAQTGFLISSEDGKLIIKASTSVNDSDVSVHQSLPLTEARNLPVTVIRYVERTRKDVVLNHASREGQFTLDPYISANKLKSLLCTPIMNRGKIQAILYLENNLTIGAFAPQNLQIVKIISSQAAISLENSSIYENLEKKVRERTQEVNAANQKLNEKNQFLSQTLQELQRTQAQLIQNEKLSSLGQMVGGVAHEINNPVNFIYGNLSHASEYMHELIELIYLYQQSYPNPVQAIQNRLQDIDIEFLIEDLQKLLNSMKGGTERIRNIVLSLRNFSRLDEASLKPVDIHEGIESTLLILQNRINTEGIQFVKDYGRIPKITCYASEINQVFLNIFSNAIDALKSEKARENSDRAFPTIRISTSAIDSDWIGICIADNGCGMSEEVRKRIFDPFFTTKPVGSGTGLGLFVSYQIIVEKHGGRLTCTSDPQQGTEFIIELPKLNRIAQATQN